MIYLSNLYDIPKTQLPARESQRAWELLRYGAEQAGFAALAALPDLKAAMCHGPHGKPYLPDGKLHFSISHSHGLAACAVEAAKVGLDVERVRHFSEAVEKRICSPAELELIASRPDRDRALTQLWTCKEAYMKYTGMGFSQGIAETAFARLGEQPLLDGARGDKVRFRSFSVITGSGEFFVTECVEGEIEDEVRWVEG